jgi:RimJ/RimL family protein N-acetyltransferase
MRSTLSTPRGLIIIRPANEADAAALGDLRIEALRNHPDAFSAELERHLDRPMEFWIDWVRDRNNGQTAIVFVAEAGDALIGMTGLHGSGNPKTRHSGLIWGVYVRPDWRGLRIADRLIEACIDWARERDLRVVKLAAVTTNAAAIRCYLRCGFSVYGVEPQAIFHDSAYYDELLMSREVPRD